MTIGRTLTDTFAGSRPSSVPPFLAVQVVGTVVAVGLGRFWYPMLPGSDIVVPHDAASAQ